VVNRATRRSRSPEKTIHCEVVSETVVARLRRRLLGDRNAMFVQCSESDCQYVDANEPPCPLTLALFADEIGSRNESRPEPGSRHHDT
jgi:hypothetical protein